MSETIPSRYNFREVEPDIYQKWLSAGCFRPALDKEGKVLNPQKETAKTYVISIPPPNVTGRLHMGHALNNTIQDMLIRYKRMRGFDALWIPGTDHAGIATQTVVKKMLDAEGIDYRDIGRDAFIEKVWEWKGKYGDIILEQLKRLGCSCDWDRLRFTMDQGLSKAVNVAFKKLYDDGLIYRGRRIVNWCPVDRTALSDDEVETKEGGEEGFLWHINYPLSDRSGYLTIATTRPETLFGDTAIAVHPEDERYLSFIGKEVTLPLQNRNIPIISDDYVDRTFGTGCLKITPAHDPNDFEIGQRHHLDPINIMNEDATMNENVPSPYRGLTREKCREQTIIDLKAQGLLVKEEKRMTPVGRSYRSNAIIEYRLSDQWFVKMKPLIELVLKKHSNLNIVPKRWEKVYLHWLDNIRDWCISRQIWWGHQIPAWYNQKNDQILVDTEIPTQVSSEKENWKQDSDVLDTWFSASLWPMSILGWPEKTLDLARYFPNTTLSTAKDIIFFWVARMNVMACYFTDHMPYKNVYIHPTVMDDKGATMSKSKGNGIDPLHIIDGATTEELKSPIMDARPNNMKSMLKNVEKKYPDGFEGVGADALRYTLIQLSSSGQELKMSLPNFVEIGRRFTTKLWNAARFILINIDCDPDLKVSYADHARPEDNWIMEKTRRTVLQLEKAFDQFDFASIGNIFYQFTWNDFCDWYVEMVKIRLQHQDPVQKKTALYYCTKSFASLLKILHPVMPFITEELWSKLVAQIKKYQLWEDTNDSTFSLLMMSQFEDKIFDKKESQKDSNSHIESARFEEIMHLISTIRALKSDYEVKAKIPVEYFTADKQLSDWIEQNHAIICKLSGLQSIKLIPKKKIGYYTIFHKDMEIYFNLREWVDIGQELARVEKVLSKINDDLIFVAKKLDNPGFITKADPKLIEKEKNKQDDLKMRLEKLNNLKNKLKKIS